MKTHILFDFDGTLIDSAPAILATFTQVLKHHQIPACRAVDSRLIGPPLRQTLQALCGRDEPELLDALSESFRALYDDQVCLTTLAYPGWSAVLQQLCERGLILAIATNKRLLPTQRILQSLGWTKYFNAVYASDSSPGVYSDKAGMIASLMTALNVQPDAGVYLGDTEQDSCAAAANQLDFWPVAWGYGAFDMAMRPLSAPTQLLERLDVSGACL